MEEKKHFFQDDYQLQTVLYGLKDLRKRIIIIPLL